MIVRFYGTTEQTEAVSRVHFILDSQEAAC